MFRRIPRSAGSRPTTTPINAASPRPKAQVCGSRPGNWIMPPLPALTTGFALAFARALGEYGSVIFIAGNLPMVSEITPLMIISKLEQYDVPGATAIAVVMLLMSFVMLLVINLLQAWTRKRQGQ